MAYVSCKGKSVAVGDRFGRLVVVGESRLEQRGSKYPKKFVPCVCDCGKDKLVNFYDLVSGVTLACGCLAADINRVRLRTHGGTTGAKREALYGIWYGMKMRCSNPKDEFYGRYGGRGITVHPDWIEDYAAFREWATANGYERKLSLDRIDNDGNYEPTNCRWATAKEQARNRSSARIVSAFGESKSVVEWSEDDRSPVNMYTIFNRLNADWIPEDAITTPLWKRGRMETQMRREIAASSSRIGDEEIASEIWGPIPGFDGYDASDMGRIGIILEDGSRKILSAKPDNYGRKGVGLRSGGKPIRKRVGPLVLMAHVGPAPDGMQCCHFPDPNPSNCRLSNLRWDTKAENNKDRSRVNRLLLDIIEGQAGHGQEG